MCIDSLQFNTESKNNLIWISAEHNSIKQNARQYTTINRKKVVKLSCFVLCLFHVRTILVAVHCDDAAAAATTAFTVIVAAMYVHYYLYIVYMASNSKTNYGYGTYCTGINTNYMYIVLSALSKTQTNSWVYISCILVYRKSIWNSLNCTFGRCVSLWFVRSFNLVYSVVCWLEYVDFHVIFFNYARINVVISRTLQNIKTPIKKVNFF